MRERQKIIGNLEELYREAFQRAEGSRGGTAAAQVDFEFQRDQLFMEALLDIRDLLAVMDSGKDEEGHATSLLERAQAIRRLTRLR